MQYRHFITLFIFTGVIHYGCAFTNNFQNEEFSKFNNQEPSTQALPASVNFSWEKYPFPKDYKEAYRYRTNTPSAQVVQFLNNATNDALRLSDPAQYLDNLTRIINSSTKDPFEKVKMVYDATTLLLDYDVEALKNAHIPLQTWEEILTTKKTVCEGYAILFKKICDLLNIPCETVPGFAQGGLLPLTPQKELVPNHAWNIVQINNFWYTIDCTWGSSTADMLTQTQTRKYTTDWLFLNSDYFRYTHFPTDSNFQLANPKLNETQFKSLPRLEPSFFEKYKLLTPLKSENKVQNAFEMKLKKNDSTKTQVLFFNYESGKSIQNKTLLDQKGDILSVTFNAPFPGTFLGVVTYNTEGNAYKGCAYFFVQTQSASDVHYPVPLKTSAKDVEIISPLVELHADSTYDFKIKVSNKKYLLLYYNGKFTRMRSEGKGIFSQRFTIPHDAQSITIQASDTEYGQYEGIVKYFIEN